MWKQLAKDGKLRDVPGFGRKDRTEYSEGGRDIQAFDGTFPVSIRPKPLAAELIAYILKFGKGIFLSITPRRVACGRGRENGRRSRSSSDLRGQSQPSQKENRCHSRPISSSLLALRKSWLTEEQSQLSTWTRVLQGRCAGFGKRQFWRCPCCISPGPKNTTSGSAAGQTIWV